MVVPTRQPTSAFVAPPPHEATNNPLFHPCGPTTDDHVDMRYEATSIHSSSTWPDYEATDITLPFHVAIIHFYFHVAHHQSISIILFLPAKLQSRLAGRRSTVDGRRCTRRASAMTMTKAETYDMSVIWYYRDKHQDHDHRPSNHTSICSLYTIMATLS